QSRNEEGGGRVRSQASSRVAFRKQGDMDVAAVLLEQVHQVFPVDQGYRLVLRELATVPAKMAGVDQDPPAPPPPDHCAVKVADGRNGDDHVVSLRLDDEFPPTDGVRVKGDCIDAPVSAGLGDAHFAAGVTEFFLKEFADEVFKILPLHCREVVLWP